MVRVTVFALAKVPTSLIKHKYVRKEASTPFLKTVHRTVFLTPSTTWSFSVVHKCTSLNSLLQLFLELLSSATGSSRSRHTSIPVIALLVVVRVTVFALAKVHTSLIKHKYVRKGASTPSLKTVHRTVFLTVAFKSRYRFAGIIKRPNTYVLGLFMVHLTRLELARIFIHMDLNHTRLPIPPQVHIY